eukprot:TRINITY_DN3088_c0_g1_i1.p1 TRINITY_DN3088_c0_g1~~TRINITY_DN3088_c0_g1_i1.p1  ORF type:complete len:119 (-),score=18.69 TRINITY_DN3088_c0_g1_i1:351-659(-)
MVGNFSFFLLGVGNYSLLTFLSYTFLLLMVLTWCCAFYVTKVGQSSPFAKFSPYQFLYPEKVLRGNIETATKLTQLFVDFIFTTLTTSDYGWALKVVIVGWL